MNANSCPACRGERFDAFGARGGLTIERCLACRTALLARANGDGHGGFAYEAEYFKSWNLAPGSPSWRLRTATAERRLDTLEGLGARKGVLFDVGAAGGYLVKLASERGYDATGVEVSEHAVAIAREVIPGKVHHGTLDDLDLAAESVDVVTLFDVLEHLPEPHGALERLVRWLKPGGLLAVTVPDVDSLTARLMGGAWPHYKEEHLFYPSRRGLRMMLESKGLGIALETRAKKCLSLEFTAPLLRRYPVPLLTGAATLVERLVPRALREATFEVSIGERLCVGRKP